MSQDEVNDQFRAMMLNSTIQEVDEVIHQIVGWEARARHAAACEEDHEAAQQYANAGYEVLAGVTLKMIPSIVMGTADLFNREHEAYTRNLDYLSDIMEHVRQFQVFWERGDHGLAVSSVAAIQAILEEAFENAIYEKIDEEP